MSLPTEPYTIPQAIARMEGFYAEGTRAARNHNPGNIEFGKFTKAHGALYGDPRFAHFPDDVAGFACLKALLQTPGYAGLTVTEAINRWAPPTENDTQTYVNNVCSWTHLAPSEVIDSHLG